MPNKDLGLGQTTDAKNGKKKRRILKKQMDLNRDGVTRPT